MDARLMARMGFLHELVGEEFSIRPVRLTNPDAAAMKVMVGDLSSPKKRSRDAATSSNKSQPPLFRN